MHIMKNKINISTAERLLHYAMAFSGGCFGVYAMLEYSNILGSAQTVNMITLTENILEADLLHTALRAGNIFIYIAGIIAALLLGRYRPKIRRTVSLVTDGIAVLVMIFMPGDLQPLLALYPLAFAVSLQWCSFSEIETYSSSTIFSTNNLRQFITHGFNFLTTHSRSELSAAMLYMFTLLFFHAGVAAVFVMWHFSAHKSILAAVPMLIFAAFLERRISADKFAEKAF